MQKRLHLDLKHNFYFIVASLVSYSAIIAAVALITMDWWLKILLLAAVAATISRALVIDVFMATSSRISSCVFQLDNRDNLTCKIPSLAQQPKSWRLTWRSPRLIVISLSFDGWKFPRSLWISPHSLRYPQLHRQLRILTRFNSSGQIK